MTRLGRNSARRSYLVIPSRRGAARDLAVAIDVFLALGRAGCS